MSAVYIWSDNTVVVLTRFDGDDFYEGERQRHMTHKFIVDCFESEPETRYGYFQREYEAAHWVHVPKEMFPKEFLTTLLLMGVS